MTARERTPERLLSPDEVVQKLQGMVDRGGANVNQFATAIKDVLATGAWEHFTDALGMQHRNHTFEEFITSPRPQGLGLTLDRLRLWVSDDMEAADAVEKATAITPGQHRATYNVSSRQGNSRDQALRRLRKDFPQLHAQVLAGELSTHAAMIRAGKRHPTISVPADDPAKIAATLRRRLTPDALAALLQQLQKKDA